MFKRVFLLWFSIIICQYSYAIFKPVQASIFYPVVKYMADIHEMDRIYGNMSCSSMPPSTDEFYFEWTHPTVQENIDALSAAIYSVEKYRNVPQTEARSGKRRGLDLSIMFSDIKGFYNLNPTGKSLICSVIKKKELSITEQKNVKASYIPFELQEFVRTYHPIPFNYEDGFIKTVSHTGDEVSVMTPFINDFLNHVSGKIVYDIGSGFGINTKRALERDARQVVAIDFSIEQLQAVIGRAPHDKIENLFISMGKVPEILSGIPPNSVDVVLLSHVLHYLKPEEAEATLKGIHEILKIDGMVYLQALTYRAAPYSYSYDTKGQAFMLGLYGKQDEYDKAVAAGKEYNPWPTYLGWLDNFRDSIPMIHPQYLPALVEACKRNGFSISQAGIYGLMDGNLSESGEGAGDALGIIAIKKEKNSAVEQEVTVK